MTEPGKIRGDRSQMRVRAGEANAAAVVEATEVSVIKKAGCAKAAEGAD
jgi:hypothetical protein